MTDNCLKDGIRDPLVIWNGTIVDGHNRFRIAHEHNLPFLIKEMSFQSVGTAERYHLRALSPCLILERLHSGGG